MIQCCRSDFVLEVNLSNKAAAVLSLTSRTWAPHLLYSTGRLQGRSHCSSISVLIPRGCARIMSLQGGNAVDFVYFAASANVFYAMFGIIFMKFWCHFGVIFGLFWGHFGVILVPRPQNGAQTWLLSILAPFWGAFGNPWGTLLEAFWALTSVVGPPRRQFGPISEGLRLEWFFE